MTEQYEINFHGHRLLIVNDHATAAKILAAAGFNVPAIPKGCNTVEFPFTTKGGSRALAFNQSGFQRALQDDEQEVNGCAVLVLGETLGSHELDDAVLEAALKEITKSCSITPILGLSPYETFPPPQAQRQDAPDL